jgi:hypothetical protein
MRQVFLRRLGNKSAPAMFLQEQHSLLKSKRGRMAIGDPIRFGSLEPVEPIDVSTPPDRSRSSALQGAEQAPEGPADESGESGRVLSGLSNDYRHVSQDKADTSHPGLESSSTEASHHRTPPEIMNVPRRVVRTDANMDSKVGTYGNTLGRSKSHRDSADNLVPAGSGKVREGSGKYSGRDVTRLDHQLARVPELKENSKMTSFTNEKLAKEIRDYSSTTKAASGQPANPAPQVTFKARKFANARLKGKADTDRASFSETKGIKNDMMKGHVANAKGAQAKKNKDIEKASGYAGRDGEFHTEGTIPKRFLSYSDRPQESGYDSDSVSDAETGYSSDESEHYSKL